MLMVERYHASEHLEHQRVLARHKIIEERKEYLEQMNTVRVSTVVQLFSTDYSVFDL